MLQYLQTVEPEGEHGEAFGYKTINSDALGWIIARVSGEAVTDLLSERIWSQMGAEQDAYFTVDGKGIPFAGGGMSAGLRDLGRIGLLMLGEGELNGERLFPSEVVGSIRGSGDKAAFAQAGYTTLLGPAPDGPKRTRKCRHATATYRFGAGPLRRDKCKLIWLLEWSDYTILTVQAPAAPFGESVGSPLVSSGAEHTCALAATSRISVAPPVEPALVE